MPTNAFFWRQTPSRLAELQTISRAGHHVCDTTGAIIVGMLSCAICTCLASIACCCWQSCCHHLKHNIDRLRLQARTRQGVNQVYNKAASIPNQGCLGHLLSRAQNKQDTKVFLLGSFTKQQTKSFAWMED